MLRGRENLGHPVVTPAPDPTLRSEAPVLGPVVLRVADVPRVLAFWEGILGLQVTTLSDGSFALAPAGATTALLVLQPRPEASPPPATSSGLYHLALLLPSRAALGGALLKIQAAGGKRFFVGASDHLVSEALYFQDPEGNGLELYRDRPREEWGWNGVEIAMATDPLDVEGVLRSAHDVDPAAPAVAPGTVLGHVHLRVGDLQRTAAFYRSRLGMDVTVASYPGAVFLSWGGYHHHLGLNVWGGRVRTRPPVGSLGLVGWDVRLPGATEGDVLEDPDGVQVGVAAI